MFKNKFFNYKPSSNVKAKICLPERLHVHFCEEAYLPVIDY